MVAAPATASDLMNCRRDVVVSIVVVLERKDGTRTELITTDFSGSIRGDQYSIQTFILWSITDMYCNL